MLAVHRMLFHLNWTHALETMDHIVFAGNIGIGPIVRLLSMRWGCKDVHYDTHCRRHSEADGHITRCHGQAFFPTDGKIARQCSHQPGANYSTAVLISIRVTSPPLALYLPSQYSTSSTAQALLEATAPRQTRQIIQQTPPSTSLKAVYNTLQPMCTWSLEQTQYLCGGVSTVKNTRQPCIQYTTWEVQEAAWAQNPVGPRPVLSCAAKKGEVKTSQANTNCQGTKAPCPVAGTFQ